MKTFEHKLKTCGHAGVGKDYINNDMFIMFIFLTSMFFYYTTDCDVLMTAFNTSASSTGNL